MPDVAALGGHVVHHGAGPITFVPRLLPDTSDLVRRGIPAVARRRARAAHTQQVSQ
jgi:hypothetical protein